jgi:hypothetical protein
LRIGEFTEPKPQPGEAVMRMRAGAIARVDPDMRDSGAGISTSVSP